MEKTASAVLMLALTFAGCVTSLVAIGFIPLFIVAVRVLADAFLIPGMVQASKETLRRRLTMQMAFFQTAACRLPVSSRRGKTLGYCLLALGYCLLAIVQTLPESSLYSAASSTASMSSSLSPK